jgi:hypothetical protein
MCLSQRTIHITAEPPRAGHIFSFQIIYFISMRSHTPHSESDAIAVSDTNKTAETQNSARISRQYLPALRLTS